MVQSVTPVSPVSPASTTTSTQSRAAQAAARAERQADSPRIEGESRGQRAQPDSGSTVVSVSPEGAARASAGPAPQRGRLSERLNTVASERPPQATPLNAEARPPQGPPPGEGVTPAPARGAVQPGPPPPSTDPVKTVSTKPVNPADADADGRVSGQESRVYDLPQTAQKDQMRAGSMLTTRQGEEATRAYLTVSQQPLVQ